MRCSEYIKGRGLKSLSSLSEASGVPIPTIQRWYKEKKKLLDLIIDGVKYRELKKDMERQMERQMNYNYNYTIGNDLYRDSEETSYLFGLDLKARKFRLEHSSDDALKNMEYVELDIPENTSNFLDKAYVYRLIEVLLNY